MEALKSFFSNTTSTILSSLSKYAVALLGGALTLSVAGNGLLMWRLNSAVEKKVECVTAVEQTKKVAIQTKERIEGRQERVKNESSSRISSRVNAALNRLQNSESRGGDTPSLPGSPEGTPFPGRATVVLPRDEYERDKRICVKNTIFAEEWQDWYKETKEVYEDEIIEPKRGIFSVGRGSRAGSVQGLSRSMDMGLGDYEQFGTRSLPSLQGQAPDSEEMLGRLPLVDGEEVPTGGTEGVPER